MLYLTTLISNACLAILNCGLCLSATNLARMMLLRDFKICPEGSIKCDKERWYFATFYFTLYMSAFFGCLFSLYFRSSNRRKGLMGVHYLYIIGSLLTIYSSPHIIIFLFSQAFFGLAIGGSVVTASCYILEYTPKDHQKFYGFYIQVFFALGLLISYIFGAMYANMRFSNPKTTYWVLTVLYKLHLALPLIISVVSLLLFSFTFTMDTPLHLYESKKFKKFDKLKTRMNIKEFDEKEEYHKNEKTKEVSLLGKDLTMVNFFQNELLRKTSFVGMMLCFLYSLNGSFLFFNAVFLFFKAFSSTMANTFVSVAFVFLYFISSIVSTRLIQTYGKKDLLITGLVIQAISAACLVGSYFLDFTNLIHKILLIISISSYFVGLSLGFGHMIWTHVFDLFPKECKVVGAFFSYYSLFLGAFLISVLLEFISTRYYSYLFILCLISLFVSIVSFSRCYKDERVTIARHPSMED
ncbi:sugar transporter, putative [Plasmodium knowlesi strain H]|uniref:Sugar transporter, putative n=3 Tax=Plasmodium knowlesi TaxID=5850 RepID=A0A5K1V0T6_PLAKH|nr:major facilitator superfamily domain-containing protein, putative [Plasmodium knowlesi strain H]OTN67439.1 putative Sugar transporter [Plasmodium knowlesi]CAA9987465.1 major facilitator superfamily domain-containing protein, putative [Plasmodium knowlesi strain H]SBO23221.1 sugar transporter, putative [Plasmodium knowlesi strain H]SBO24044.1 sugar transporter, putative [Plasmodium knowlesi strain H]VVS76939.1 major facilitator superfamily domain-containing protein, putative [Plasmodium know|eukprot:XP_002258466.1 sugar transporter, putative [Plasmodium knowlesi strain H]